MTNSVSSILDRLENGEIKPIVAAQEVSPMLDPIQEMDGPFLNILAERMPSRGRGVHIKISLRLFELGINLGARYMPELNELDWHQIIANFIASGDRALLEVEDYLEGERITFTIENE